MSFAGYSWIAVIAAALVSWLFGAVWYMSLSKAWLAALGKTKEELVGPSGKPSRWPFLLSFAAQIAMAFVLAGLVAHLGPVSVRSAVISGLFVWFGFVLTTLATNHAFSGARPALTLIDAGHWLGVLVIQGLVIGLLA